MVSLLNTNQQNAKHLQTTVDQVLFGTLIGAAFWLYFLFVARKPLDIYILSKWSHQILMHFN